ncbi:MAG: flagellar basal body-associated FliL family protein [Desulfovibrio sp.]|nr:flagellar basal body-associated FliL family protein [Desulfovibrio sp.]
MSQRSSEPPATTKTNVAPDVAVAQSNMPAETAAEPVKKVELDIEDAPFLKEEPPEEKEEKPTEPEKPEEPKKKKKLLFIVVGAVAVVLIAGAGWFLFGGKSKPPPPPAPEPPKPDVIVVPSKPATAVAPDIIKEFERFVVPVGTSLSATNFLICKFSTVTKNPTVNAEIEQKMLVLRDAVYFYLRGKSYEFLLNPDNATTIKKDLVGILNDYLGHGKLEDVLLDSYLGH